LLVVFSRLVSSITSIVWMMNTSTIPCAPVSHKSWMAVDICTCYDHWIISPTTTTTSWKRKRASDWEARNPLREVNARAMSRKRVRRRTIDASRLCTLRTRLYASFTRIFVVWAWIDFFPFFLLRFFPTLFLLFRSQVLVICISNWSHSHVFQSKVAWSSQLEILVEITPFVWMRSLCNLFPSDWYLFLSF
jgi:hypothetical protein